VTLKDIPVRLRLQGPGPKSVRVLSPDPGGSRTLRATREGSFWTCTLPELKVYAVLVLNGARL
jgi:hypothetical protein